mgnify:FL=1
MNTNNKLFEAIKLKDVFDVLAQGMIVFDENDIIIAANQIFCDTFSINKKDIEGRLLYDFLNKNFYASKNKDVILKNQYIELENKEGKKFRAEHRRLNSEITDKPIYIATIINKKSKGTLESELQKQLDLKHSLKDKLNEESELSDMKSRFLSIASHEFRTPLAGILSSLNLINRYLEAEQKAWFEFKNKEKIINHLQKIDESVKNLTTILQKFLALGNIEKGEIPIKQFKFDLRKAIEKQVSQFQEICKPNQHIMYSHTGRRVNVTLDKYLLKNIMNNLLSNAIKFSPDHSNIYVHTSLSENEINISVKDQGIGIPRAEQNKIYRRFYRAKNALTYEEGTGLGLNIVRKYVELMKGKITFESDENKGTTFNITFTNEMK